MNFGTNLNQTSISNIEIYKIICYGKEHILSRAATALQVQVSASRTRYVLGNIPMPAMLNTLGIIKCINGEMVWIEDSLSSFLTYAKL